MAITRCPYCHAIIDENDKYCNNCGTQLLFSEDEEVEEEIPGEKIIDADVEEKDYTVDEPKGEKRPAAVKDLESEVDEDVEEELRRETEETALDELVVEEAEEDAGADVTEEVILVDEIEETEAGSKDELKKPEEEEPVIEYITEDKDLKETAAAAEAVSPPVTFDTQELEEIGETVELGGKEVDKFIEAMAEKRADETPPPKDIGKPSTGTLPPWASSMKGAPVFPEDTGPVEPRKVRGPQPPTLTTDEEVEIFPRRRDSDSTMGLPERVIQTPLPFGQGAEEGEEKKRRDETQERILPLTEHTRPAIPPLIEPASREVEAAEKGEKAGLRPPFSFSVFFKSKGFDVLFVGLFWLVALWLAAYSMGLTLFEILGSMSGSMLLLYAVFVFLYFFLFKFFLGETLGDRLFRPRE